MAVIYLQHPVHGAMVFSSTMEADGARANGWVDFVPVSGPVEVKPVELPSFFGTPVPEDFPARERLMEAGHHTLESIPRDVEELVKINGIGNATALKVLDALEG